MRSLSKSKLLAFRQSLKLLWRDLNRPELIVVSAQIQANFDVGHPVGEIARRYTTRKAKAEFLTPGKKAMRK